MKQIMVVVLCLVGAAGCTTANAGDDSQFLPPAGNALVVVSDLAGEHSGVAGAVANFHPDHIGLLGFGVSGLAAGGSPVNFGRGYSPDEWERLMNGEELALVNGEELARLARLAGGAITNAHISVAYETPEYIRIYRDAVSERLTRNGDQLTWVVEFGEPDGLGGTPVPEADPTMTTTVTFSPSFSCSRCVMPSEVEDAGPGAPDGTCLLQDDPMLASAQCREVVEMFDLVEHGFVDPALFE